MTRIERIWRKRLADSGFVDIEGQDGNLSNIDKAHGRLNATAEEMSAIADGYTAAQDLLRTHKFPTTQHRAAWKMHADGSTRNAIAKELGVSKWAVDRALAHGRSVLRHRSNGGKGGKRTTDVQHARRVVSSMGYEELVRVATVLAMARRGR